ncbi:MAG: cupin domain-containing protein [Methylocystis sp.]
MTREEKKLPAAVEAASVAPRDRPSNYPEPFAARVAGREKRALGEVFGLLNFGVNLTRLAPGAQSALMHRHSRQDEFIYILEGAPTLVTEAGETELGPGMCAGFPAGGLAHHLVNRIDTDALYLEVGDRTVGDRGGYPADDLEARLSPDGRWQFFHKDGRPY